MNVEIYKIVLAFFVGLIPFILKIIFDNLSYKKSQSDKFGVILFEKQLDIYIDLYKLLLKYQNTIAHVIIAGSYGNNVADSMTYWYNNLKEDSSMQTYYKYKLDIETKIDENTILLSDNLLKLLYDYIEYSTLLWDTNVEGIYRKTFPDELSKLKHKTIETRQDLKIFNDTCKNKYSIITLIIKALIGTEQLSKRTLKYTNKDVKIEGHIHRFSIANLEQN